MVKTLLEKKRYFFVVGDRENLYQQNGKYVKRVEDDTITSNEIMADIIDVDEFKHLREHAIFGKLYFCNGCKYFSAMIEGENYNLKEADMHELNRPSLFVLTYCNNTYNHEKTEGNTRQEVCPLEKFKR